MANNTSTPDSCEFVIYSPGVTWFCVVISCIITIIILIKRHLIVSYMKSKTNERQTLMDKANIFFINTGAHVSIGSSAAFFLHSTFSHVYPEYRETVGNGWAVWFHTLFCVWLTSLWISMAVQLRMAKKSNPMEPLFDDEDKAERRTLIAVYVTCLVLNCILWLAGATNELSCNSPTIMDPYKILSLVFALVGIFSVIGIRLFLWLQYRKRIAPSREEQFKSNQVISNKAMLTFFIVIASHGAVRLGIYYIFGYKWPITTIGLPVSIMVLFGGLIHNHSSLREHSLDKVALAFEYFIDFLPETKALIPESFKKDCYSAPS